MRITPVFIITIILVCLAGCTEVNRPISPNICPVDVFEGKTNSNRGVLGIWDVRIISPEQGVEIIPNRDISMHLNIVMLLETTPCSDCLTVTNPAFLPDNIFQCDLGVIHPYPDVLETTGFDLRGIFITEGDTDFSQPNLDVSFDGTNPVLISPDGYTSLFSPEKFYGWPWGPEGVLFTYQSGKFALGDDDLDGTLNPFVAYGVDNPRRMFEAGSTDSRTIKIQYQSLPMEFGYAIDISWIPIDEVVDPLNDFPPEANCLEPYELKFQMNEVLANQPGSSANVTVEVSDHQGIETVGAVTIECPELFSGKINLDYSTQTGTETWEFTGSIVNVFGESPGIYPMLVTAKSNEEDQNFGALSAYWLEAVNVECSPPEYDNLMWAKHVGGYAYDGGHRITSLQDDSIVITGKLSDTVTFGAGEANETTVISDYWADQFIAQYFPDGSLAWATGTLSKKSHDITGVSSLSDGSVVVCGFFRSSITMGNGEPNETILTSVGSKDMFLARYNSDGSLAWAERAGGTSTDECYSITVLQDDSIIISGRFRITATFGEGDQNETTLTSDHTQMFIARYTSNAELIWAIQAIGGSYGAGYCISELSDDSFVVAGNFEGSTTFGEGESNETTLSAIDGSTDIFLARYNPNSQLVWAQRTGGANVEVAEEITGLSDDSFVVSGRYYYSTIFGAGEPNETILDNFGGYQNSDIFLARFNQDSSLTWAKRAGGDEDDQCRGISTLSNDSIIITGDFYDYIVFGVGESNETTLIALEYSDIFVAAYDTNGLLTAAVRYAGDHSETAYDIAILSDDSYVITGTFRGKLTFGECGLNETTLNSGSGYDFFVVRHGPL